MQKRNIIGQKRRQRRRIFCRILRKVYLFFENFTYFFSWNWILPIFILPIFSGAKISLVPQLLDGSWDNGGTLRTCVWASGVADAAPASRHCDNSVMRCHQKSMKTMDFHKFPLIFIDFHCFLLISIDFLQYWKTIVVEQAAPMASRRRVSDAWWSNT